MLFNSIDFILFFLLVTVAYYVLPHRHRWILLLGASCYFYMAFVPIYILILAVTIVIDYFAGIWLENSTGKKRKRLLYLSLAANIGVLVIFKYYNFFLDNLGFLLKGFALSNPLPRLDMLLPIGLSFHTFQAMSYTIEVYRGNQKAERHFGIYSLYVMFYPQLVAGPIERPQNLLGQFRTKFNFDYNNVAAGLKLMLWGFVKKLVIADRLGIYVDAVYGDPAHQGSASLILATIFFSFQIYADFSGYTDIAIGAARVMGFKLMTNFRRPFLARSTAEVWKRWHISLSSWFRDYLYISIGGNRVTIPRWYLNLFIVFLVSGLWHGASWTFIIWGGLNGFFVIFGIISKPFRDKINRFTGLTRFPVVLLVLQILTTFLLTSMARIFFRATSISDALLIVKKIFTFNTPGFLYDPVLLFYAFTAILLLMIKEIKEEFFSNSFTLLYHKKWQVRTLAAASLVILIILAGVFDGGQFIYFQF
jgi:D-alanyl-lipoteichoic acid acyltransferase DltB (MBOAT superfamily)